MKLNGKQINLAPRFINFFSRSTQLSMKFVLLINLKLLIAKSFLLNITENKNFSANKYENANYWDYRKRWRDVIALHTGNPQGYKSMVEALHTIYNLCQKPPVLYILTYNFLLHYMHSSVQRRILKQSCFVSFLYFFIINLNLFTSAPEMHFGQF